MKIRDPKDAAMFFIHKFVSCTRVAFSFTVFSSLEDGERSWRKTDVDA